MPPEDLPRRRFLQTSATATGLLGVSLAGCTDFVGGDEEADRPGPDRDRPAYAPYVPAEGLFSSEEAAFGSTAIFVDFRALADLEGLVGDGDFDPTESIGETKPGDEAFFATPTIGLVAYALSMFGLVGYPFTDALMPSFDGSTDDGSGSTDLETDVGVVTSFGFAFVGDYDVDAVSESAESFAAVDSREGFEIFEAGADGGDDYGFSLSEGLTFAASSEAVLVPFPDTGEDVAATPDPERGHEMIDRMIDVVSGGEQNAADADGDVDWAFRAAGHGAFGVAAFGDQDLTPEDEATDVSPSSGDDSTGGSGAENGTDGSSELVDPEMAAAFDDIDRVASDATAYASSLEPTSESELVAHVALGYESADDAPSESDVEDVFGDTSGEFSMETGERHVYLSSTYSL